MSLQLRTRARLSDLHCCVGLTDWDMDTELKLATTTDQFHHDEKLGDQHMVQRFSARGSRRKDEFVWYDQTSDTFVKPSLWLLVNPNIACPVQHREDPGPAEPEGPLRAPSPTPDHTRGSVCQPARSRRKGRTAKDCKNVKPGCWPRPPVNYCILIALALKSSLTGSLKVQQIYNFTREHFPFFQTAPDGWKNTIRHNLCFNSSFRKTCNQLWRDGKRKSCFWHLTVDGHRRLTDEIGTLTGESFKLLERSMARPDVIRSLLAP